MRRSERESSTVDAPWRRGGGHAELGFADVCPLVEKRLPYANVCLEGSRLGLVLLDTDLKKIPHLLNNLTDVPNRLDYVQWARLLFTVGGSFCYVKVALNALARALARDPNKIK